MEELLLSPDDDSIMGQSGNFSRLWKSRLLEEVSSSVVPKEQSFSSPNIL
jgi:hypothetical protein